jgi:tetracycline 7-halogenase / FADH2 O2-dependent halogenase
MTGDRFDVAVVGAGFAGSILARVLARRGLSTLLVERGRHPRFALGESSTPLAALSLERLAARWDLPDLRDLAAYGRWRRSLPHLRRGLKRGFTFYAHCPGEEFVNSAANEARLLVAASPDDEVADAHWLRADVDHHLVREAAATSGVTYVDRTALDGFEPDGDGFVLHGAGDGRRVSFRAGRVVDAGGRHGFLGSVLDLGNRPPPITTSLIYAHLTGVRSFVEAARAAGADLPPGPYPDERAAVHHLLAEGWLYALPFDHGPVSCGMLLRDGEPAEGSPEEVWRSVLDRYPTLASCFAGSAAPAGFHRVDHLPHRRARAAGDGWFLLPHAYAFFDPLFSTGIAWSLLAVERLAELLCGEAEPAEYGRRLEREADGISALVEAAYLAMPDFRLFTAVGLLYFAAASFSELEQRLRRDLPRPAWRGFLRADDPVLEPLITEAGVRLRALAGRRPSEGEIRTFAEWVADGIAPRNLIGLADPARRNLYPLDAEGLVERAGLLGMTPAKLRGALSRLR